MIQVSECQAGRGRRSRDSESSSGIRCPCFDEGCFLKIIPEAGLFDTGGDGHFEYRFALIARQRLVPASGGCQLMTEFVPEIMSVRLARYRLFA